MKKIILLITVAIMMGCESFLDTESFTSSNTNNFPMSEEDATQMVTGVYSTLNLSVENCKSTYLFLAELASDDRFGRGAPDDPDFQALDHLLYNDTEQFGDFWTNCYKGIGRANMAIANLDKISNEETKNQLLGEVHFLRSFFYFQLTQLFGKVPLITEVPQSVGDAQKYPSQASEDDVYAFIVSDLYFAIENMPNVPYDQITKGHVSKWDAEALLARVFLFYTGFYNKTELPMMDLETMEATGSINKQYVVEKLEDCIKNSGHDLLKDFRSLWPYTNSVTLKGYQYAINNFKHGADSYAWVANAATWNEDYNNAEQMFSISCAPNTDSFNSFGVYYSPRKSNDKFFKESVYPLGRGWGAGPVNPALWNEWKESEPEDIRRQASILNNQVEGNLDAYTWGNDRQMEESGMWQKKTGSVRAFTDGDMSKGVFYYSFWQDLAYGGDGSQGDKDESQGHNITIIRFADVLLMHSELTQTADGLNRVRSRAGLNPVAYSLENIQKERRHEFAFESLRWGDMRRWGDAYAINALTNQLNQPIYNNGVKTKMKNQGSAGYAERYKATRGMQPIPKTELTLSNGVLKQTEGWDYSASYYYSIWTE